MIIMKAVPESHAERSVHDYGYEVLTKKMGIELSARQIRCFQRMCPSDGCEQIGTELGAALMSDMGRICGLPKGQASTAYVSK